MIRDLINDWEWVVIGRDGCVYCEMVMELLRNQKNLTYLNTRQNTLVMQFVKDQGFTTVPQVYHRGLHVGGYAQTVLYVKGFIV